MSCPDWQTLTADPGTPVPAAAWTHAESCPRCRDEALRADPTLIFRRLPAPRVERAEVDSMRAAVAAMRRDRALDTAAPLDVRRLRPRRQTLRDHGRTLLAALAAAVLLAVLLPASGRLAPDADRVAGTGTLAAPSSPAARAEAVPEWLERLVADQPLAEWADGHHVTQLDAPDLSLVVVSVDDLEDPRLDV